MAKSAKMSKRTVSARARKPDHLWCVKERLAGVGYAHTRIKWINKSSRLLLREKAVNLRNKKHRFEKPGQGQTTTKKPKSSSSGILRPSRKLRIRKKTSKLKKRPREIYADTPEHERTERGGVWRQRRRRDRFGRQPDYQKTRDVQRIRDVDEPSEGENNEQPPIKPARSYSTSTHFT